MAKQAEGYGVNDLTQYRAAPAMTDGNTATGFELSKFNSATSAFSGLLDFGTAVVVTKLYLTVRYQNVLTLAWHYSEDGTIWTAFGSSVLPGIPIDSPLPAHVCAYENEGCTTTLAGGGISARYWRVSLQDSDVHVGSGWQCGGLARGSSKIGLMEIRAQGSDGATLREPLTIELAHEKISGDVTAASAFTEVVKVSGHLEKDAP